MPTLGNPKHELFAQELAKGKSATEAYEIAGYRASRHNAARLKSFEHIAARVAEIQAAGAKSAEVSVASLLAELETARQQATDYRQLSAAIRAIEMKGKVSGVLIERQQIEVSQGSPFSECTSESEMARKMADDMLDGITNARWLPISETDREQLAGMIKSMYAKIQAFVDEVSARPLIHTRKIEPHNGVAQRVTGNGKGEV